MEAGPPDFRIIVDDLVTQTDEGLASRPLGTLPKVALWVLRDARRLERFYEHLRAWAAELQRLIQEAPDDAVMVMRYILMVAGDRSLDDVRKRIIEVAPAAEVTMATVGEKLIQEGVRRGIRVGKAEGRALGKAEGRALGKTEGKAEGVLTVLAARGMRVTAKQRARIVQCKDVTALDRWLRLAVTVNSVDELFSR